MVPRVVATAPRGRLLWYPGGGCYSTKERLLWHPVEVAMVPRVRLLMVTRTRLL